MSPVAQVPAACVPTGLVTMTQYPAVKFFTIDIVREPRGGIFDEISEVHEEMYEASLGSVDGAFDAFQKAISLTETLARREMLN